MTTSIDVVPDELELEPRVFGIEGEHGIRSLDNTVPAEACAKVIRAAEGYPDLYGVGSVNHRYLSNGARFYMDTGSHAEYATPECLTIRDLVASDWAGKLLMRDLSMREVRDHYPLHVLNTRVVDEYGATWGSHENYRTNNQSVLWYSEKIGTLIAHLATRNVLVGAGRLIQSGHERFVISQKTHDVVLRFGSGSTQAHKKPFVLTRLEPLAGNDHQRIQIVGGDPTMSPWATAVRFGSTSLVLRLIEAGIDLSGLEPVNIKKANAVVSQDLDLERKIDVQNGSRRSALDIQKALAHCCLEFTKTHTVPDEEAQLAIEWVTALDDLQEDPTLLTDRSDWVAKRHLIEQSTKREEADPESKRNIRDVAWSIDHLWGELSPSGIGMRLVERGKLADPLDALCLAEQYICEPPAGRAKQRGDFIKLTKMLDQDNTLPVDVTADWMHVGSQRLRMQIKLEDPFGDNPDIERALAQLRDVVYAD